LLPLSAARRLGSQSISSGLQANGIRNDLRARVERIEAEGDRPCIYWRSTSEEGVGGDPAGFLGDGNRSEGSSAVPPSKNTQSAALSFGHEALALAGRCIRAWRYRVRRVEDAVAQQPSRSRESRRSDSRRPCTAAQASPGHRVLPELPEAPRMPSPCAASRALAFRQSPLVERRGLVPSPREPLRGREPSCRTFFMVVSSRARGRSASPSR
jgi:hypothetical protein